VAQRFGSFGGIFAIQLVVLVVLNVVSTMRARRAQKRWEESGYLEEAKPTSLLLPIYTRIMWLTCLCVTLGISFSIARPYSLLVENKPSASIFEALSVALRQYPYDALCWCLLSQGAGPRSFTRALKWAGIMAFIHATLRLFYVFLIDDNYGTGEPPSAVTFAVLCSSLYAAFYYVVWLAPGFFRRPAARPYAAFWAVFFSIELLTVELRYFRVDFAYCFTFGANAVFYLLSPLALYNACASDSLYWQGALTAAARADLQQQRAAREAESSDNKHLDDAFSENPLAPTVAMTVAQADSLGIPLVNFNALSIDIEGPEDVGAGAADAGAPPAPVTAPATALRTLRADEARRAKRAAQAAIEAGPVDDSSALGQTPKEKSVVLKLLGQGSFARVYKGSYMRRPVAIKLIYAMELTVDLVRNLYREAASLGALRSRYVVGVEGVCVMPPAVAMVMELCAGSLFNIIHGRGEAALEAIDAKVPEYEAAQREQACATAEAKRRWRLFRGSKKAEAAAQTATEAARCDIDAVVSLGNVANDAKPEVGVSENGDGGGQGADEGGGDGANKSGDAGLCRPTPRTTTARVQRSISREPTVGDGDDGYGTVGFGDSHADGLECSHEAAHQAVSAPSAVLLSRLPPDVAAALQAASTTSTGAAAFCKPALSLRTQVRLALDCCAGVAFLHTRTRPVVHLDIKSGNFLVGRDGVVKIADMELSTRLLASEAPTAPMPASACRDQGALTFTFSTAASPTAAIDVGFATKASVTADLPGVRPDISPFGVAVSTSQAQGSASVRPSPILGPIRSDAAPLVADCSGACYTSTHGLQAPSGAAASSAGAGTFLLAGPLTHTRTLPEGGTGAGSAGGGESKAPSAETAADRAQCSQRERARGRGPSSVKSYLSFHGHPAFAPAWTRHGRVAALAAAAAVQTVGEGSVPGPRGGAALADRHTSASHPDEAAGAADARSVAPQRTSVLAPASARAPADSLLPPSTRAGAEPEASAEAAAKSVETLAAAFHRDSNPLSFPHGAWGPWPAPSSALAQLSDIARAAVLLLNRGNRFSNLGADGFLVDEDGLIFQPEPAEPFSEPGSVDSGPECVSARGESEAGFCGASRRPPRGCAAACTDADDCAESSGDEVWSAASLVANASVPFGMGVSELAPLQPSTSDVAARRSFANAARPVSGAPAAALPRAGSDVSVTSLRDIALGAAANAAVTAGLCDRDVAAAAATTAAAAAVAEAEVADDGDDEGEGDDGRAVCAEPAPTLAGGQMAHTLPRLRIERSRKAPTPPPLEPPEATEPALQVVTTASSPGSTTGRSSESLPAGASRQPAHSESAPGGGSGGGDVKIAPRLSHGSKSSASRASTSAAGGPAVDGPAVGATVPATPRLQRLSTRGSTGGLGSSNYVISTGGFRAAPAPAAGERSALAQHLHDMRSCLGGYCTLACVSICFCPGCSPSDDARGGLCGGIADLTEQAHAGLELALDDSDDEHDSSGGSDSSSISMNSASSSATGAFRGCCSAAAASARRRARQTLRQRHERRLRRQLGKRRRALTIPEAVNWLAPEFMRMEPFGTAADVYSLACVLWEIVAREVPYQELTDMLEAEERAANTVAEEARQARNAELRAELRRKREAEADVESAAAAAEGDGVAGTRHIVLNVAPDRSACAEPAAYQAAQEVVRQVQAAPASVRRVLALATSATSAPTSTTHGVSEVDVILAGAALDARTHATTAAAASSTNPRGLPRTISMFGLRRGHSALGPAAALGGALIPQRTGADANVLTPIASLTSLPRVQTVPSSVLSRAQLASASGAGHRLAPLQQRVQYTRDLLSVSVAIPHALLTRGSANTAAAHAAHRSTSPQQPFDTDASVPGSNFNGNSSGVLLLRTAVTRRATSVAAGTLSASGFSPAPLARPSSLFSTPLGARASISHDSYAKELFRAEATGTPDLRGPLPPPSAPLAPEIELPVRVLTAPGPAAPSLVPAAVQDSAGIAEEPAPTETVPMAAHQRRSVTAMMRELIAYGHYRPPVPAHTHPVLAELIIQGWHPEPSLRPTALEMHRRLLDLYGTLETVKTLNHSFD
jgi:serine/threonine protein kinase